MQEGKTIFEKYSMEISAIDDSLSKLHKGQVMEISGLSMDGKLSTNVEKLHDLIDDLLNKIANEQMGDEERIGKVINSISLKK